MHRVIDYATRAAAHPKSVKTARGAIAGWTGALAVPLCCFLPVFRTLKPLALDAPSLWAALLVVTLALTAVVCGISEMIRLRRETWEALAGVILGGVCLLIEAFLTIGEFWDR